MRRTERLFAIAEHLRARRSGTTAEELAARFGVTVRTMYRDLASLQQAELPLRAERGRGGGYALDRAYSLPPVNFNAREAAVLITAGRVLERMRIVPFLDTLGSALDKVAGALNKSGQRELSACLESLSYVGVPAPPIPSAILKGLEQAWFEQAAVQLTVRVRGRTEERRVMIRQIIMDRGCSLLNCDDLDKSEPRQFRLDRVESIVPCGAND